MKPATSFTIIQRDPSRPMCAAGFPPEVTRERRTSRASSVTMSTPSAEPLVTSDP